MRRVSCSVLFSVLCLIHMNAHPNRYLLAKWISFILSSCFRTAFARRFVVVVVNVVGTKCCIVYFMCTFVLI